MSGRENGTRDERQNGCSQESKAKVVHGDAGKTGVSAVMWGLVGQVLF